MRLYVYMRTFCNVNACIYVLRMVMLICTPKNMGKNRLVYSLLLFGLCVFMTNHVMAQDSTRLSYEESARIDSLVSADDAARVEKQDAEAVKQENRENMENLSELKSKRTDTKAQAKEARRIERDATDAARESRAAYRSEKNAQKARKQADKQAKEAANSRRVSDSN